MNKLPEGYIEKSKRTKILLMCDDIRFTSGIATMAREIVVGTSHRLNWVNVGAAINHPEYGKRLDLSQDTGKTYSISQLLALYIPIKEKVTISVVSPSLPHLKRGARRDILQILEDAQIYSDEAFNKTDNVYHYPNGSYIEFFGAEDSGKVRGPGRDILFINEANLLPHSIYSS